MSNRVTLPAQLTSATLTPTSDGLVFNNNPPSSMPLSPARPLAPASAMPNMTANVAPPPSMVLADRGQPMVVEMAQQPTITTTTTTQQMSQPMVTINEPAKSHPDVVVVNGRYGGLSSVTPMSILIVIFVFCIIFMVLLATKPNMVTDLENGTRVLNNAKLFFWTIVFTIIINVLFWVGSSLWYRK